jgi:GNAT superfamily N-acetyltransferase
MHPSETSIAFAAADQAFLAVEIWREAAQWLLEIDRPLWSLEQFNEPDARSLAAAGELVLGFERDAAVCCMTLKSADPILWPEKKTRTALYLHKIAVRRASAGRGWTDQLVDWAATRALALGITTLRLDCDPRPELMRLYENLGFGRVEPDPVRHDGFSAIRYERHLRRA